MMSWMLWRTRLLSGLKMTPSPFSTKLPRNLGSRTSRDTVSPSTWTSTVATSKCSFCSGEVVKRAQGQIVDGGVGGPVELWLGGQEAQIAQRAHDALGVVTGDVDVGRLDVEVKQGPPFA
jgi:hypothetical protein